MTFFNRFTVNQVATFSATCGIRRRFQKALRPSSSSLSLALLTLASLVFSGCSTIRLPASPFDHPASQAGDYSGMEGVPELPTSEAEQIYRGVREARASGGMILHLPGEKEPVRVLPLPPDGRSVYVSNLLKQSGVQKKFGNVEATLYRHSSASINGIPLECRMSRDGDSVRPECDYALQAGDRLSVRKATHPAIQGLINGIIGR